MIRVELLVRPHKGDKVLYIGKVSAIVLPAWNHMDILYSFAANLKAVLSIRMDIALSDSRATTFGEKKNHFKLCRYLPLVVPCFKYLRKHNFFVSNNIIKQ